MVHTVPGRTGSCLIVEDELVIGMDLEDAVGAAGYEAKWVATRQNALAAIEQDPPDVAVIDVQLGDGSCGELVRELVRRRIPFIVHSGSAPTNAVPDLGGVPWLTKPAEPAAILKALSLVLQRQTGAE